MRCLAFLLGAVLGTTLLAGAVQAQGAAGENVLARVSPLPVVAADGQLSGSAEVGFGEPLAVIDRQGDLLTVKDGTGQQWQVRSADVLVAPNEGLSLWPTVDSSGTGGPRLDLPLWDSALRSRLFLGGKTGQANATAILTLPGQSTLPAAGLPVLAVDRAASSVGVPVTLVQALMPLRLQALDPTASAAARPVVLHVLVDGSDYARDFMMDGLRQLSRGLAAEETGLGAGLQVTRAVVFGNGTVRDEGLVAPSGLRAEWPAGTAAEQADGLAEALAQAVEQMSDAIDPSENATHVLLLLLGPGLSDEAPTQAALARAGERLETLRAAGVDLRAVMLQQATPEPNPLNQTVLAGLAGAAGQGLLGFGEDPLPALAAQLAAVSPESAALAAEGLCRSAAERGLPCLLPTAGAVPTGAAQALAMDTAADWVAVPLWFVADSAPFDLVPDGSDAAKAHPIQEDIRACHALGGQWDITGAGCLPRDTDVAEVQDRLQAVQADLNARIEERDQATTALAEAEAQWQEDRAALEAGQADAEQARDAALAEVAGQQTALEQAKQEYADLEIALGEAHDRGDALEAETTDLTQTLSELTAAKEAVEQEAENDRTAAAASLEEAQAQLASLQEEFAQGQDEISALTQARDDVQARLAEAEAATAEAESRAQQAADRVAALEVEAAEMTAAAEAEKSAAADKIAGLEADLANLQQVADRVAVLEAESAKAAAAAEAEKSVAAAKIAALEAELANLHQVADRVATLQAQVTEAAGAADTSAADQITALQAELARLQQAEATAVTARDDLQTRLAAAEDQVRQAAATNATAESSAAERIAALQSELAELRQTEEARALAAADAAAKEREQMTQDLAAMQAERDALSVQLTEASALSGALAATEAERDALAAEVLRLKEVPLAAAKTTTAESSPETADDAVTTVETAQADPAEEDSLFGAGGGLAQATITAAHPKKRPAKSVAEPAAKIQTAPAALRQVAPSTRAKGLNGCTFQWAGQEGKLICP